MHVVAIAELRGEREAAALALAPVLGTLAYEIRSRLGATLPVIVYRSGDAIEAAKVLMEIQRLGHGALALDTGAMGPALEPLRVHGFEWDDAAAYAVGPSARQALPWSAVGAVVMMQDDVDEARAALVRAHRLGVDPRTVTADPDWAPFLRRHDLRSHKAWRALLADER